MQRTNQTSPEAKDLRGADPLEPRLPWRGQMPGEVLRLGLMYADGRRTATFAARPFGDDDTDPGRLVMLECGSQGSSRRWDGEFWVYPLPPEGPVNLRSVLAQVWGG